MNLSAAIREKREHLAQLRTDRVIRAIRKELDFSRIEFWDCQKEVHIVTVSPERVIKQVGLLWK